MLVYCDYIASRVKTLLDREIGDNDTMMKATGPVNMDLHPTKGYFMSTKKTMGVTDINGKNYMITIEEID
jgi:hypothetical protein